MIMADILKLTFCIYQSEHASSEASTMDCDGLKVPVSPNVYSKPISIPPSRFKLKSSPYPGLNLMGPHLLDSRGGGAPMSLLRYIVGI